MQHRNCVEAVDRTLQDILNNRRPFGGITIVLGGDFRQILPVVPKGVREDIILASLRRSYIWRHVKVLSLSQNMRLSNINSDSAKFAKTLLEIGTNPEETIRLPSRINQSQTLEELICSIYPRLQEFGTVITSYLTERTILSARNDDVSSINTRALEMMPGKEIVYLAADILSKEDSDDWTITNRYPTEYINSLDPPGLPPFKLMLKVGCPVMLLRNIAPKDGLCNGTRLMVVRCATRLIEAMILKG
ncbi:hypothetical protein GIB67_016864 [Kingdonia uniflora]|uniref:ATP-dependent DNA helicase n=1 Tax=Kingdonia uniflora TaxID=39325 RepID=A0A7J7LQG0_9MAGN|nr:hypothetical protein GIB67_016864 [Kingdonia uniflora]